MTKFLLNLLIKYYEFKADKALNKEKYESRIIYAKGLWNEYNNY